MILVDALRNEYPLEDLLDLVELARSSYYYQRKATASPDNYLELREQVKELFEKVIATGAIAGYVPVCVKEIIQWRSPKRS